VPDTEPAPKEGIPGDNLMRLYPTLSLAVCAVVRGGLSSLLIFCAMKPHGDP
jgi:hypothetical protein